jgi:hypothetical protein
MSEVISRYAERSRSAFRAAWVSYVALLMLPFVALAVVVWSNVNAGVPPRPPRGTDGWFLLTMAYVTVGVPAALLYRRRVCVAHAHGGVVAPRKYLAGMLSVWLALEGGMILPVVGCYVTGSFLPGLLPALVSFVFFVTLWPNGEMLTSYAGDSEDPEIYREPR